MRLTLILALLCSVTAFAKPGNLCFIENKGQVKDQFYNSRTDIQFSVPGNGMTLFIGNGQIHYQFAKPVGEVKFDPAQRDHPQINWDTYRLDMELIGANQHALVTAEEKQEYYENHFLQDNYGTLVAHTYKKITYKNIYPHIDWVLYIKGDQLKHEFIVNEGGDPSNIKMKYIGATSLGIGSNGQLFANTPMGNVTEVRPYSYQQDGKTIASAYKLIGDVVSFEVEKYQGTLVIDPTVQWINNITATDSYERTTGLASSGTGSVYACGITVSANNIATIGAHQYTYGGNDDGYITKTNSSGVTQWTTYYGGGLQDYLYSITFDENAEYVYAAGLAFSNTNIGTPGTQEPTSDVGTDGFIVKFDTNGTRVWGTYINGTTHNFFEGSRSITHDEDGNVYVAGLIGGTGVATAGTHQTSYGGGIHDVLLSKYNSSGMRVWATYFGGSNDESKVALSYRNGKVFIAGTTLSTNAIATTGAYQTVKSTDEDAFVAKFDTTGDLEWSSYFGQNSTDEAWTTTTDDNGNVYVGGNTESTNMATTGAHQVNYGNDQDGFIAKFNGLGGLEWSTYYGGSSMEYILGLSYAPASDAIYFAGYTSSNNNIATTGSYQSTLSASTSGFFVRFNALGTRIWGTYISTNSVSGMSMCTATDPNNIVYLGGSTVSQSGCTLTIHKFHDCQKPILTGNITGEDTVCAFSSQPYSGPNALEYDSYAWILPNTWVGISTTTQINTTSGNVSDSIYFFATNSCGSSDTISMHVQVNDPDAMITINNFDLTTTTTFNSYQWYYNGSPINNATGQTYTATQDGSYYVIVTDAFGCTDTSNAITATVSIDDISKDNTVAKIYPNPATNELTIEGDITNATIFSSDGRKVVTYQRSTKRTIDISSLSQGVYFIQLENEERKQTVKFTKR